MVVKKRTKQAGFSVVSLGCPMNQVDSESLMGDLVSAGFRLVPENRADVVIVNTCGFIGQAIEESLETIREILNYKKKGKVHAVIVMGCLVNRDKKMLADELNGVDAFVRIEERDRIPGICSDLLSTTQNRQLPGSVVLTSPPNTAYLKISEGCDNRCTYCTIPSIRGPFRSVESSELLKKARSLSELGVKELILIGQDTTSYGSDLEGGQNLGELLENLNDVDGIEWIRMLYANPLYVTPELIRSIKNTPKVIPYIDIPLQHIASSVLKRMGRGNTSGIIEDVISSLRREIANVVLRTAFIVGFPGETEEDFMHLMEFAGRIKFERAGAFIYSPEEGTPAALLKDSVDYETALERFDMLMQKQSKIAEDFHRSLIGKDMDVIIDDIVSNEEFIGRTYMDAPEIDGIVKVHGDIGGSAFGKVKITHADVYDLEGELI